MRVSETRKISELNRTQHLGPHSLCLAYLPCLLALLYRTGLSSIVSTISPDDMSTESQSKEKFFGLSILAPSSSRSSCSRLIMTET